jgi:SAM-dependent methyltransferase
MTYRSKEDFPKSDYKEYPKTLAADDFWGQVRRTVHGKPVSEEQIQAIVQAIVRHLDPQPADTLLDMACGNGALSRYLFDYCAGLLGVDYSEYLIGVAKANFERKPRFEFTCSDAATYIASEPDPRRFTKVLCYGSFSYFPQRDASLVLQGLRERFCSVQRVYLGNLPDKDRAANFYPAGKDYARELSDHAAQVGVWRSQEEFATLAASAGWRCQFVQMPPGFFGAHYRYDVLLEPQGS